MQTNLITSSVRVYRGLDGSGDETNNIRRGFDNFIRDVTYLQGEDLTYAIINGLYGGGTQARGPNVRGDQGW